MRLTIMLALFLAIPSLCLAQATWYVPDDFSTIQGAISDASVVNGDTVIVRPGTYVESISFNGKAITLKSELGAAATVIDGNQTDCVVKFLNNESSNSVLDGFTLKNGFGRWSSLKICGGGITCYASSPTIMNNIISEGSALYEGGGIYCASNASPNITYNTISGNTSYGNGAGIFCDSGSVPDITYNTIMENTTTGTYSVGGISCENGSNPMIANNIITCNSSVGGGDGIYCDASSPTIANNDIVQNGGIGISCNQSSAPTIQDNNISTNSVCGIYCYYSSPIITGNTIDDNGPDYDGGGIDLKHSSPFIGNNKITNNAAKWRGGGISCRSGSHAHIKGNLIQGNTASDSTGRGGGIYCYLSSPTIEDNTITENEAYEEGGGVWCNDSTGPIVNNTISKNSIINYNGDGGGIWCENLTSVIKSNTIVENMAGGSGGGIRCYKSSPTITNNIVSKNAGGGINCFLSTSPTITNNFISRNNAIGGGGLALVSSDSPTVMNNVIIENRADQGGGIYCSGTYPVITNNTILLNIADNGGGLLSVGYAGPTITNTIVWGNTDSSGYEIQIGHNTVAATVTLSYSDLKGGQASVLIVGNSTLNWGSGMIDADPLLVNSGSDDIHLKYDSPCRDAGDNSGITDPFDFEGDPRIAYGAVDMGADEFYPHLYFTGEANPGVAIQAKCTGLPGTPLNGIIVGVNIFDPPLPCDYGLWYMKNPMQIITGLGIFPADGVLVFPGTIPATPPAPYTIYLQAAIDSWLTNLCIVDVQ